MLGERFIRTNDDGSETPVSVVVDGDLRPGLAGLALLFGDEEGAEAYPETAGLVSKADLLAGRLNYRRA